MVHSSPIPPLRDEEVTRMELGSRVASPTRLPPIGNGQFPSRRLHGNHISPSAFSPLSKIPIPIKRDSPAVGVERAPSPMPRPRFLALMEEINSKYGMSRHGKASGSAPAAPSAGTSHSSTTSSSAVPVPVAQQAQQYLEQNIKAWMQPKTHDQVSVSSLANMATSTGPDLYSIQHHTPPHPPPYSASLMGLNNFAQVALQEHTAMQQQLSQNSSNRHPVHVASQLTSPSSGYSDIGAPYYGLNISTASAGSNASLQRAPFPHSLSFSGYSHHSFLQGTSYSTPCANTFATSQPSAAASFFARAAQRLNLSSRKKRRTHYPSSADQETTVLRTNFADVIRLSPPLAPPGLVRTVGRKEGAGIGKVKVMLRICPSHDPGSTFLSVDGRKKQVTLCDPSACGQVTPADRRAGVSAPKMFAFDAVFSPDDTQTEVCASSLTDVIQSVVNGTDGCLFVYGHSKLGKTYTMVGSSESAPKLGVIPCAITWLFKLINEQKHKTGARFSVRVSAVEVSGALRDLLAEHATGTEGSGTSPGVYLREDPIFGAQLMNQSELRAPNAEKAAFLLDVALASRTPETDEESRNSHFLFTLHVYQYRVEKGGRGGAGGRSRLHLFDLGSCEKPNKPRDASMGGCLSLSALGNVILALFNGQKHVPYKDNKLTQLLREALGSLTCRAAMIAHVSASPAHYAETLATIQLASRVHRLRRKKLKCSTTAADGSCDDKGVCRPFIRMHAVGEEGVRSGSSDPDYTSSSEQSCDTVIYVGAAGMPLSDRELTDNEGPPSALPVIRDLSAVGGDRSAPSPSSNSLGNRLNSHHHPSQEHTTGTLSKDDKKTDIGGAKRALQSTYSSTTSTATSASSPLNVQSNPLLASPRRASGSPRHHRSASKTVDSVSSSPGKDGRHPTSGTTDGASVKANRGNVSQSATTDLSKSGKLNTSSHSQQPSQKTSESVSSPQSPRKVKHHSQRGHSKQEHASTSTLAANPPNPNNSNNNQSSASNAPSSSKGAARDPKLKSDEQWIDGPRFNKPKFDSRTLHQLQKEQWVDGPGMFGLMDVHKENMIRKWVEDHSKHVNENYGEIQKEVWIDFPPSASGNDNHLLNGILEKYVQSSAQDAGSGKGDSPLRKKSVDRGTGSDLMKQERHLDASHVSSTLNASSVRANNKTCSGTSEDEQHLNKGEDCTVGEVPCMSGFSPSFANCDRSSSKGANEPKRVPSIPDDINNHYERHSSADDVDEISSNSADVDEMDNDEDIMDDFDMEEMDGRDNMDCVSRLHSSDPDIVSNGSPKYIVEYGSRNSTEGAEPMVETIEVMEPEEPVTMQDSCLQVTEEDIFAACYWPDDSSLSENPLPEVDQESSEEGSEHPLRVLSDEGLNLASTFSESRAVSVDLDSISVPETWREDRENILTGLTWRLLHGYPSHRKKKVAVAKKKDEEVVKRTNAKNGAGGTKDFTNVENNELAEKLESIARLRHLLKKTTEMKQKEVDDWPTPHKAMYGPPVRSSSRLTMSEMMFGSRESSLEELREMDATSIHSEPAELDIDKYDFQFSVKPMNGLRLEAFYNRIHKVPVFPDQPQYSKPTQVVSPIIVQTQKKPLFSWRTGPKLYDSTTVNKGSKTVFQSPESIRKKLMNSLRHPDGASDPQLNKHPSITELVKKPLEIDTSHAPPSPKHHHQRYQRSPGNGASTSDVEDRGGGGGAPRCLTSPGTASEEVQPLLSLESHVKDVRTRAFSDEHVMVEDAERVITTQPEHHQSSTISARLSRLLGVKGRSLETIEPTHSFKHSRRRNSPKLPSGSNLNLPSRSSSSKGHLHCKAKQLDHFQHVPSSKPHSHHSCLSSSSSWTPCSILPQSPSLQRANTPYDVEMREDLTPSQKAALLCRSTSTPTSPFMDKDSGNPCIGSDSDVSSFPSPYTKMAVTWLVRHSSSGRGSDSSVTSNDLKETKELLGKVTKTQQFSGTSSGYESMPRDSEGTPLSSSSQESSSEVGCKREGRGRKGTRKKPQGSGKRSRSVPARAPIATSTTWQHISVPIERQPVPSRGRLGREWNDPTLWKSEEELCCTGLLCCKILDFY